MTRGTVASMASAHAVPTIDLNNPSPEQLAAVDTACREHGFFLLAGHGEDALIEETWDRARRFFAGSRDNKMQIVRDQDNPMGWFDRELTKRRRDHKEVFDFLDPKTDTGERFNRWPAEPDDFRDGLEQFYATFSTLAMKTTALVHRALGLDDNAAADYTGDPGSSAARLNHYPVGDPVPADERDGLVDLGETALGWHTDPGVLTMLLQDDTGGLQTQARDGEWVDVPPQPGTIVINMGDTMQVWTNDQYRAAIHRVIPMTSRSRMSIPYFLHPPRGATLEPIPALAGDAPRYRPFTWKEFINARSEDNFSDLGQDDTQISNYAMG